MATAGLKWNNITNDLQVIVSSGLTLGFSFDDQEVPLLCDNVPRRVIVPWVESEYSTLTPYTWVGGYFYGGVAQSSGSDGDSITVARTGISSAHSDLVIGTNYYATYQGQLSMYAKSDFNQQMIGVAISSNEILLYDKFPHRVFG